jgi:hypothetical protein
MYEYIPEIHHSRLISYVIAQKQCVDRFDQGDPLYKQYAKIVLDPFFPPVDKKDLLVIGRSTDYNKVT